MAASHELSLTVKRQMGLVCRKSIGVQAHRDPTPASTAREAGYCLSCIITEHHITWKRPNPCSLATFTQSRADAAFHKRRCLRLFPGPNPVPVIKSLLCTFAVKFQLHQGSSLPMVLSILHSPHTSSTVLVEKSWGDAGAWRGCKLGAVDLGSYTEVGQGSSASQG